MSDQAKSGDPGDKGQGNTGLEIEVDGEKKTVTAEDYMNLVNIQKSATTKFQSAAAAVQAAERYGVSVEDFINHAEGTMGAFSELVNQGIIDATGKVVEKKSSSDDNDPNKGGPDLSKVTPEVVSLLKKVDLVSSAIEEINKRTEGLERDQLRILQRDIHKELKGKHPELNDDDVRKVFGLARGDRNKTVWQHAEEVAGARKVEIKGTRETYAKEFGIDLKKFDANKIDEADPNYGSAALLVKGRKLSFGRRKGKGDDSMSPRQATEEYFKALASR